MNELIQTENNIQSKIFTIRSQQVMIDRDLAELYHIETKVFNQAVKRNIKRFPDKFRFQLNKNEKIELVTNCDRFQIDESVLTLFSKNQNIKVTIYTKSISKQLKLDLEKYNSQYDNIEIIKFNSSHDKFLIIDDTEVYHIGASLKDLGKKWFGFSKMDSESFEMMGRLK